MKTRHNVRRILASAAISLTVLSLAGSVSAQDKEPFPSNKNRGALYYIGDADELMMQVNIWGFVARPGQYMVPKDTDLISLISYAGGPREEAKIKKIKVIRKYAVLNAGANGTANGYAMNRQPAPGARKLDSAAAQELVYEVNVKKYLKTGDVSLIPELKPGDTVVVEGSTFHFVNKALDFAGKLAIFVNIYYLVQIANRN